MASSSTGRIRQRKGWVRSEKLPEERKQIDWWSASPTSTNLDAFGIAKPSYEVGFQAGKIFCVNGIASGPAEYQRIGRSIRMKSIRIKGTFSPPASPTDFSTRFPTWAAITIIYDKKPQWTDGGDDNQATIDCMNRWNACWKMVNADGVVCTTPWTFGSNRDAEDSVLILANERFELPASYPFLDLGRDLLTSFPQQTIDIPIQHASTRGKNDGTDIGVDSSELLKVQGFTHSFVNSNGSVGGMIMRYESGQLDTNIGKLNVDTDTVVGFIDQTIEGTIKPTGFPSTTLKTRFIGTSASPDTAPGDEAAFTTRSNTYLLGDEIPDSDPPERHPIVVTTTPAHEELVRPFVTYSRADPGPGPVFVDTRRSTPIPFTTPTGMQFDIWRTIDLPVTYQDSDMWTGSKPQQITEGAVYIGVITDTTVGWTWKGWVRITYDDERE